MRNVHRWVCFFVVAFALLGMPKPSFGQVSVGISVRVAPPPIPVYAQPICPGPGYLWTPGYWAWGPDGYYWVPGTWVVAPRVGFLWTPGYWGWSGGFYRWHAGYWGPHVGFYGGVNYGYGYTGVGFVGGEWRHGAFFYNRSVSRVNVTVIHNTYNRTIVVRNVDRVSFNGGEGGLRARPTPNEERYDHEQHLAATADQIHHREVVSHDRAFLNSVNHGHPTVGATQRPGEFNNRRENNGFHPPEHRDGEPNNRNENRGAQQARPQASGHQNHGNPDHGNRNNNHEQQRGNQKPHGHNDGHGGHGDHR